MITISTTEKIELNTLIKRLREAMPKILAPFPIDLAYLYGSAAKDATTNLSDIDIALVSAQSVSVGESLNLELDVQSALSRQANVRNADVRMISEYPLAFQGQVVLHGILLYGRNDEFRIEYETRTRDTYLDFKPMEDRLLESLLESLRPGGMMLDRKKLLKLLQQQRDYLNHLRALSHINAEKFIADPNLTGSARYYFVVAIETCLDIGNHVIAAKQLRAPTDYADVFTILGENQIVPAEFTITLGKMIGFRNLLVHVYAQVDDQRVYEYLTTRLTDFEQFQQYILQFLDKQ